MKKQINVVKTGCNTCQREKCNGIVSSCPGKKEISKNKYSFLELSLKNSLQEVSTLLSLANLVFVPNDKGYGFQLLKNN